MDMDDTIFAPASIPGSGAISVIRVSGPDALKIADTLVTFKRGTALSSEAYTLKYGKVEGVDEVLVSIFRAPHSYTGEDSVEISCHASSYVVSRIMELLAAAGGRSAEPGEFTRRAFVNGKMDLAQAEAVADLISSSSEASHRIALNQVRGGYSSEIRALRAKLIELSALLELELDFSEEDVEFADRSKLYSLLEQTLGKIDSLATSFRAGNAIKNGVPVAIVGAVNSGKSTLLNALLGEERAIVSDIAGTTRDTVEEVLTLGGVQYRFIDTAGIRETGDLVEKMGITRSIDALKRADVVICVLDGAAPIEEVGKAAKEISSQLGADQKQIWVRNKVDIYDAIAPEEFPKHDMSYGVLELKYPAFGTYELDPESLASKIGIPSLLDISAKSGEGLDRLRSLLSATQEGRFSDSAVLVTNQRHYEALRSASTALRAVRRGLDSHIPSDLLAEDLRAATRSLSSITGDIDIDKDILGMIFEKFCVGK